MSAVAFPPRVVGYVSLALRWNPIVKVVATVTEGHVFDGSVVLT